MCRVLNASAGWVLGGFGDGLTSRRLHFIGIGLGLYSVEIQIQFRLIDTVEILQVSECDQLIVAKAIGLIGASWAEALPEASAMHGQIASVSPRVFIICRD